MPPGQLTFPHATALWSGTSFAAPRVAGTIAAAMTAGGPALSPREGLAEVLAAGLPAPEGCGIFVD